MSTPPPDPEITARRPEGVPHPVDLSRRKLGMGLGVSAVFTLASRPVLAAQCMSASSAASGNLSRPGDASICTGLSPAEWVGLAQPPSAPDKAFVPLGNPKFHDAFARGSSADWGEETLYEVMGGTSGRGGMLGSPANKKAGDAIDAFATANGPNPISAEFAATLLNIHSARIPANVLTEIKLMGMWNEWLTKGAYEPMAGATWDPAQIVSYLQSLQGA